MIEPLFGSNASNWAGMPSPGAWPQPGVPSRLSPFGASALGGAQLNQFGSTGAGGPQPSFPNLLRQGWDPSVPAFTYGAIPQPYGFAPGVTAPGATNVLFGSSGPTSGPILPGMFGVQSISPFVQEFPWGVSASTILGAVAMRRGQPAGPTTDQEVEEFLYDALELLPGTSEVDVRCENGRTTLTGSVQHKRLKHDVGEIAWAIPLIGDVQNNLTVATRRRARAAQRESEPAGSAQSGRKG